MPRRIHQRRTRGWRLPSGAKSVARPSRYGNPFRVVPISNDGMLAYAVTGPAEYLESSLEPGGPLSLVDGHRRAVRLFRKYIIDTLDVEPLRGLDLACYCPPGLRCHVDVLLELANASVRGGGDVD